MLNGNPYALELRVRKGDGTYRWFLACYNPVHDVEGGIVGWYAACTDIQDRKEGGDNLRHENVVLTRAEERIRQQEAVLRQMLDHTPLPLGVLDDWKQTAADWGRGSS